MCGSFYNKKSDKKECDSDEKDVFEVIDDKSTQENAEKKLKREEKEYSSNLEKVTNSMLSGLVKAENVGNFIINVWHNAIYEVRNDDTDIYTMENGKFVDDFNDALFKLHGDEDFINSISEIQDNRTEVTELMKKLKILPRNMKKPILF